MVMAWPALRMGAVIAAGAVVLAVSCGGGSGTVTPARPPPCATSALRVWFGRQVGLYTGHVVRTLVFVNRSGAACVLGGYPAVAFVAAPGGRQVGAVASRVPGRARQVVLAPGGRARATLVLTNVLDYSSGCSPRHAWGLRIYPPGQRAARYLALPGRVCSGPVSGFMSVGPAGRA
jgi:uncharacterized protein DUF4232